MLGEKVPLRGQTARARCQLPKASPLCRARLRIKVTLGNLETSKIKAGQAAASTIPSVDVSVSSGHRGSSGRSLPNHCSHQFPSSQRPLWMHEGGLRCGSALSQPKSTRILLGWPGAKNQEDGDAARELAAAFAFSFWQLAPMAGEAGAARICSKRRMPAKIGKEKRKGGGKKGEVRESRARHLSRF